MASLKPVWTMSLACGLLVCSHAAAQIAPGTGDKGPIATTSDKLDRDDTKRMTILTGAVEALQNGARLVSDKLTVYSYGPGEGPNAQAKPPAPGGKAPAPSASDDTSLNGVKQMIAEGHVFYVTPSESARGDRMVYDAEPDTITMTGGVIAVQGKNVLRADKMIIDRKTGLTTVVSNATGRNNPDRVRAVIYNDNNQSPQGQAAQGQGTQGQGTQGQKAQGQTATKAPPAPAKKP